MNDDGFTQFPRPLESNYYRKTLHVKGGKGFKLSWHINTQSKLIMFIPILIKISLCAVRINLAKLN